MISLSGELTPTQPRLERPRGFSAIVDVAIDARPEDVRGFEHQDATRLDRHLDAGLRVAPDAASLGAHGLALWSRLRVSATLAKPCSCLKEARRKASAYWTVCMALVIKGEKEERKDEKGTNRYLAERRFGSFQRSVSLPQGVDTQKIDAAFKSGPLRVTLPKTAAAKRSR